MGQRQKGTVRGTLECNWCGPVGLHSLALRAGSFCMGSIDQTVGTERSQVAVGV